MLTAAAGLPSEAAAPAAEAPSALPVAAVGSVTALLLQRGVRLRLGLCQLYLLTINQQAFGIAARLQLSCHQQRCYNISRFSEDVIRRTCNRI
jgi:hypothetical protein